MKRYIYSLCITFLVIAACEKIDNGGDLCGCTYIADPAAAFVVKSGTGADLLSAATPGYFRPADVKLWTNTPNGSQTSIQFSIRPPFTYPAGNAQQKYDYHQIYSAEVIKNAKSANQEFYLQLGNGKIDTLQFDVDFTKRTINQAWLNKKVLAPDPLLPAALMSSTGIYVLNR